MVCRVIRLQHDVAGNMAPRLLEGTFLGYKRSANTYLVANHNADIVEPRAVQRRPIQERWSAEILTEISATPWSNRPREPARRMELVEEFPKHETVADDKVAG